MDPVADSGEAIRKQLDRMLSSATFQGASRSRALLRFLVEETLSGRSERLKEYTLGAEVLGKGDAFDPRTDPIVRAEASRLRNRLDRYYASEGRSDALLIELPKGAYVPQFGSRDTSFEAEQESAGRKRFDATSIWFAAGIAALTYVAAAFWASPQATLFGEGAVTRFDVALTSSSVLSSEVGTDVMLSPDGTRIVFASQTANGESHLNTRKLDQPSTIEMTGTEGARGPFFSPDGLWVAFWAAGKLKKIAVAGGSPQILCDAPDLLGGSWGDDGNIIAAFTRTQLWRIPSSGGLPTVIADLKDESPRWPQVLPGATFVLFTAVGATGPNGATIDVLSLSDGTRRVLVRNGTYGRYLDNGYLTYVNQGTLFAVPFGRDQMAVRGTATPILDDVAYSSAFGFAEMDVSRTGTLVYRRSFDAGQFIVEWMDATGGTAPLLARPGHYIWPRLSPDGQRLAVSATESGADTVLVHDGRRDQTTRLSALAGAYGFPLWTRDGGMLVVGGATGLAMVDPTGAGKPQPLLRSDTIQVPWSFSPDGRRLAYHQMSPSNGFDLWTVPVQKTGTGFTAGAPEPFLQTAAFEVYPSFSPDGRWLAYSSNESGTWEVYVRGFPDDGTKVRVSTAGGRIPVWSSKVPELLYETDQQTIMAATYSVRNGSFVAAKARQWSHGSLGDTGVLANFDVSPDGRLAALMPAVKQADNQTQSHATFILNFFEMVRRQAALPDDSRD
jgi:eukaryotic-like serine/threonine-protein kinase